MANIDFRSASRELAPQLQPRPRMRSVFSRTTGTSPFHPRFPAGVLEFDGSGRQTGALRGKMRDLGHGNVITRSYVVRYKSSSLIAQPPAARR